MTDDPDTRHQEWPVAPGSVAPGVTPATTAIVTVNHNTRELIVQLVWTIYRALGPAGFARILVVDNASTDGSRPILQALADDGLIDLVITVSRRSMSSGCWIPTASCSGPMCSCSRRGR